MPNVYELNTSRKYVNNEGKPRAERVFVVTGADTEGDVVALFGSTLPGEYDHYPNDAALPYDMLAFDFSITREPIATSTWNVIMRYRAEIGNVTAFTNPTSTQLEPNEIGYRTARLSMSVTFVDLYRRFATVSALQTATGLSGDIGGISMDVGGNPISGMAHKQEIAILITDQYLPSAQAIAEQIGTRNDSIFLNYTQGTLLFTGCNVDTIPEVGRNSIEYRFVFDQANHCIQYPVRANNGSPILATAASGSIAKGSAQTVYFQQPFPYTSNFSNLSQYFGGL